MTARIVFVMPRCRHDDIRSVHKQAWSLSTAGYEVVLVVKEGLVDEYLGMRVVEAMAPFRTVFRPLLNLPALFRQVRELTGDVHVLRNPDTIPLAFALILTGHKVVYDTAEDFSRRPLIHPSLPNWARRSVARMITTLERILARVASGVVVTQVQQLATLGGCTMLLQNAPLTTGPIVDAARTTVVGKEKETLVFIYVGAITRKRGVLTMLSLIEQMNRECACRLDLVGWIFSPQLEREVRQHPAWRYVAFHGEATHAETLMHIQRSDIGLAILDRVADYPTSSITKIFEYMQFGLPIIASDFPAWRVSSSRGPPGYYVDPASLDDLVDAGRRLASDRALRERMGEVGRRHVEQDFNWELVSKPFNDLVASLVRRDAGTDCRQQ